MFSLPQEIEVWYILPAIRRELSGFLVKKHNSSYEKAGNILGISKSAVSQYLSNKRATKLKIPKEIKKEVETSSDIINKDNKRAVSEIQRILKIMRKKGCCCPVCREYNPEIIKLCGGNISCG